ncbi:MAG: T9SS type A sorting domain-containing protein [Bacteroidota bacterium]|nr:T9SS type A sorting domain-containing protein [Bacteroidota bacterium]
MKFTTFLLCVLAAVQSTAQTTNQFRYSGQVKHARFTRAQIDSIRNERMQRWYLQLRREEVEARAGQEWVRSASEPTNARAREVKPKIAVQNNTISAQSAPASQLLNTSGLQAVSDAASPLQQNQHSPTMYQIPFASSGNTIELAVENISKIQATNVSVELSNAPSWLTFDKKRLSIASLAGKAEQSAVFTFAVGKSAPVNFPAAITFTIINAIGEKWTKEISVQVSPPEKYELFQNYPNPFNPTTTISYQLPAPREVSLKIYDAIGREVTTLTEGLREAGYHEEIWNATNTASGMYIYQLEIKNETGKAQFFRRKMILLR